MGGGMGWGRVGVEWNGVGEMGSCKNPQLGHLWSIHGHTQ